MRFIKYYILSLLLLLTISPNPNEENLNFYTDNEDEDDTDYLLDLKHSDFLARWHCETLSDIGLIIRYFKGDVECLSDNGFQCLWGVKHDQCESMIERYGSGVTSLKCGEQHKKVHGITGYSYPNHWCAKAARNLYPFMKLEISADWRCDLLKHLGVIVRYINGDIECLSHDGKNCIWNTSLENCFLLTSAMQSEFIVPLTCGEFHNEKWSGPGYNIPHHWCAKALQFYRD